MTKSHSDSLLTIAVGVLEDVRLAYPEYRGVDRDIERLTLLVSNRGLGVFTLDLPLLDSLLLEGLECGRLNPKGTTSVSKRCKVPRFLSGLYLRIFDRDLMLREMVDPTAVAMLRQILCLGKKTEVPCSPKRNRKAIEEYVSIENQLYPPSLTWGMDTLGLDGDSDMLHLHDLVGSDLHFFGEYPERDRSSELLFGRCQRVADFISEELGTYCPDCVIDTRQAAGETLGLKHGPGAVAERSGKYFDKFLFTNWSAKLSNVYPWETTGRMPNDSRLPPTKHEVPARLIMVPKTAKSPRIIAAEPSEHMFCQMLLQSWLNERIKQSIIGKFISFKNQSLSGELALRGSLDGSLATIDLSSASDRLSLAVVERIFRRNPSILRAIHASRTRWLRLPNGECIELKKFASQGTALTFPIQTLVFLVIALAVSLDGSPNTRNLNKLVGKVRVYGDDIIIPSTGYVGAETLLHKLQLKMNREKSYVHGKFRESCGVDAYMGYDVTPVKPKSTVPDSPASCQAALDTTNNLFYKGYWNASNALGTRLHRHLRRRYTVVGRDAGATGCGSYSFGTAASRSFQSAVAEWLVQLQDGAERRSHLFGLYPMDVLLRLLRRCDSFRLCRLRTNHRLQRIEVKVQSLRDETRTTPYDCGYSGLLHGQLCPPVPGVLRTSGLGGVPERPRSRMTARWVALTDLFS